VVVFLQRDDDLAFAVDRDEFRLGVFRGNFGQASQIDLQGAVAIQRTIGRSG
jgi:hypothetical protein